jgi:hypothetical protein
VNNWDLLVNESSEDCEKKASREKLCKYVVASATCTLAILALDAKIVADKNPVAYWASATAIMASYGAALTLANDQYTDAIMNSPCSNSQ